MLHYIYKCSKIALRCCLKIIYTPKYCYDAALYLLMHQNSTTMLRQDYFYTKIAL